MRIVVEPPLNVTSKRIRAIVAVDVSAGPLPFGGVAARGEKRPLAFVLGAGAEARLVALDGSSCDPAAFGLTWQDLD